MSYAHRSFITGLLAIALIGSATIVHAESTVWTNTSTARICMPNWGSGGSASSKAYVDNYGGPCTATRLWSRNVSIEYNVRVVNETRGTVISCGSTVSKGDQLSFEFVPHHYTDIAWSGVGYSNDTPYGDWIASAGPPAGSPHQCLAKDRVNSKIYAPLSVAPPSKTISGEANLGCGSLSGGVMKCTPTTSGNNTVVFNFGATSGRFYGRTIVTNNEIAGSTDDCLGSNSPMRTYTVSGTDCRDHISSRNQFRSCKFARPTSSTYTLPVPARTIACPITVVDVPEDNTPPSTPALTSAGSCQVGQAHTITMSATDPDGDKIRYLVDWNSDGISDQFVPSSGHVDSGTAQSASRTFGTPGSKTVRVRTEDEHGALSNWANVNFSCDGEADPSIVDLYGEGDPNLTGATGATGPSTNDLALRALPSLVRTGATTRVHWSSQNMTQCAVTGSNGDSWSGLNSQVSGEVTGAISSFVTFMLSCRGTDGNTYTKSATVNVLPSWVEK